ncbi:hypothetical protein F5B19DRAFT_487625 [Rostrohypoxylon terebratum]|nr:hypothetical protein F5B19DRAFT_487625 [Rostrohypoxylon terebratum]
MGASAIRVLVALAPAALPAAYLAYLGSELARKTVVEAGVSPPGSVFGGERDLLPEDVLDERDQFVVARECVTSLPVPVTSLRMEVVAKGDAGQGQGQGLLEDYLSATMCAFAWTPQALIMSYMGSGLSDPDGYRRTFEARYLKGCRFRVGDRVCGVYVVRGRREGRAVLGLSPPPGWKGPVVTGALNVGFDLIGEGDRVKLVNETVLWRRVSEKPTLLEGGVGRRLHTLMVSWLVVKGIGAVTWEYDFQFSLIISADPGMYICSA